MCKLFGQSPGKYLGLEDPYLCCAVDLACAAAYWEDDNTKLENSRKKAGEEAISISEEVRKFQEQLSER